MTKLKPCPNVLCGSEDVVTGFGIHAHFVECRNCGAREAWADSEAEAIAYWNDRPQVVDVKRLISRLSDLRDNISNDYNLNTLDEIIESLHNGGYHATAD